MWGRTTWKLAWRLRTLSLSLHLDSLLFDLSFQLFIDAKGQSEVWLLLAELQLENVGEGSVWNTCLKQGLKLGGDRRTVEIPSSPSDLGWSV